MGYTMQSGMEEGKLISLFCCWELILGGWARRSLQCEAAAIVSDQTMPEVQGLVLKPCALKGLDLLEPESNAYE